MMAQVQITMADPDTGVSTIWTLAHDDVDAYGLYQAYLRHRLEVRKYREVGKDWWLSLPHSTRVYIMSQHQGDC